jgi:hypothetical protein
VPIQGALVYLVPGSVEGVDGHPRRSRHTDAEGYAVLRGSGPSSVGVRAEGYVTRAEPVTLSSGEKKDYVLAMDRGLSITGRVVDATSGETLENGIRVEYERADRSRATVWTYPSHRGTAREWSIGHVDPEVGTFRISGLSPAPYELTAKAVAGYTSVTAVIDAPREGVELRLPRSCTIRLRVSNWPADFTGVLRMKAYATSGELMNSVQRTTGDGTMTLDSRLAPGRVRLEIDADGVGYADREVRFDRAGEAVEVVAALLEAPSVRLTLDTGERLEGFLAFLGPGDGGIRSLVPASGLGLTVDLRPGRHRFRYLAPRSFTTIHEVGLGPGDEKGVVVRQRRPTVVRMDSESDESWAAFDALNVRRPLVLFRGRSLVHIGDEVVLRRGDELLLEPPAEGVHLRSLGDASRDYELTEGALFELTDSGLRVAPE